MIQRFVCNMLQENCYVMYDDTKECVIIDCGAYFPEERQAIVNFIRDHALTPKYLLATHGHVDHLFGIDTIYKEFGLKPCVAAADKHLVESIAKQGAEMFGMQIEGDYPPVDHVFEKNEVIRFGNTQLQIIESPGHSRGSVCFYCQKEHVLFSGDTLFRGSIGRTDLDGGSMMQIIQSLRQIAQLPDETVVYSGHGPQTTIGNELAHNPYMDR